MIRFNKYNVTNTETGENARVHYSIDLWSKNATVTIYDKDYGRALGRVFRDHPEMYVNETDSMTDYFEKGLVRISEDSPLFDAAIAAARRS